MPQQIYMIKQFNFTSTKNLLEKQQEKKQNKSGQSLTKPANILKMYQEYVIDTHLQKLCDEVDKKFIVFANNHRTHQYLRKSNIQIQSIQKLRNIQMINYSKPNTPLPTKINKNVNIQPQQNYSLLQKNSFINHLQSKMRVFLRKNDSEYSLNLRRKFRKNIIMIISQLKSMRLTIQEIFSFNLFSKTSPAYQFGKEIFYSVKTKNQQKVFRETIQNRYAIFSHDTTGKTPLIWASIRGCYNIVEILLKAGSQPNKEDDFSQNAIHYSVKYGYPDCTKLLLLYLCPIKQNDLNVARRHELDGKTHRNYLQLKNIINMFKSLERILKRMSLEKRINVFNEQYYYVYKK